LMAQRGQFRMSFDSCRGGRGSKAFAALKGAGFFSWNYKTWIAITAAPGLRVPSRQSLANPNAIVAPSSPLGRSSGGGLFQCSRARDAGGLAPCWNLRCGGRLNRCRSPSGSATPRALPPTPLVPKGRGAHLAPRSPLVRPRRASLFRRQRHTSLARQSWPTRRAGSAPFERPDVQAARGCYCRRPSFEPAQSLACMPVQSVRGPDRTARIRGLATVRAGSPGYDRSPGLSLAAGRRLGLRSCHAPSLTTFASITLGAPRPDGGRGLQ
jgi:hypothetical protein